MQRCEHEQIDAHCPHCQQGGVSRRQLITGAAALAIFSALPPAILNAAAAPKKDTVKKRTLAFENLHTNESVEVTYWKNGNYLKSGLAEINHVLRDHRSNKEKRIDTALLDLLVTVQERLSSRGPFQVISGYRSPSSNAMLRKNGSGVAKRSMHVQGKAIDIRLPDCTIEELRDMGIALQKGGVGYYPSSQFVHLDTGGVRTWSLGADA